MTDPDYLKKVEDAKRRFARMREAQERASDLQEHRLGKVDVVAKTLYRTEIDFGIDRPDWDAISDRQKRQYQDRAAAIVDEIEDYDFRQALPV